MSQIPPTVEHIDWAGLTFVGLQNLTEPTAYYLEKPDPQAVLRRSLMDETVELIEFDDACDDAARRTRILGELGDVLWHCPEIPRAYGFAGLDLLDGVSLDDFQNHVAPDMEPKTSYDMPAFGRSEKLTAYDRLAISVLRCVKVMNPKDSFLRLGADRQVSIVDGVVEVMRNLAFLSSESDLYLSEAAKHVVQKLFTRKRRPHILEEPGLVIDSSRKRLAVHPLVNEMFTKYFLTEA